MSWIEKVQTDFIVTTGDGRSYFPEWLNAIKQKDFNVAEFEFPEVSGSLINRRKPKGRKFNIEIYFQGEDHLDLAEEFETSSEDERPWVIQHPLYGQLLVQPLSLTFDNKDHNITKITGVVAETLLSAPRTKIDSVDAIASQAEITNTSITDAFVLEMPSYRTQDYNKISDDLTLIYEKGKKSVKETLDAEAYFNLFNDASTLIDDITEEPIAALRAVQAVINAPVFFVDTVRNRINTLIGQFELLRAEIESLDTRQSKKLYENNAGIMISSIAQSAVVNFDYQSRNEVFEIIELITDNYDQFIEDLDSLQTTNANSGDSYIPDAYSLSKLSSLVNFVIANLFSISTTTKQERKMYLENESNVVLLTHRFYGLDASDETIQKFMNDNSIGLNEYLLIKQGREIIWFV